MKKHSSEAASYNPASAQTKMLIKEKTKIPTFVPDYHSRLMPEWFQRDTAVVAEQLLGMYLVVQLSAQPLVARIVETEAYLAGNDAACHAASRKTPRNAPMFEQGGVLYVYTIYGMHRCMNIVTETQGRGCAVLLRAAEPIIGTEFMQSQRYSGKTLREAELLRGPGNLAKAMGFGLEHNFLECYSPSLWLQKGQEPDPQDIVTTTRIGISKSAELPLRFYLNSSSAVSARRALR